MTFKMCDFLIVLSVSEFYLDVFFSCLLTYLLLYFHLIRHIIANRKESLRKWRRERPDWFKIEMIPDEYLSKDVFEEEGGAKRRRSSVSLRDMVGLRDASVGRVHPQAVQEMRVEDL